MIRTAGIDPGLEGYACLLDDIEGVAPEFFPAPTRKAARAGKDHEYDPRGMLEVALRLEREGVDLVAIEEQQGFPSRGPLCPVCGRPRRQQGIASTFQTGLGFGLWLGVLASTGLEVQRVAPQEWKGPMGLSADKDKSVALARRLAPEVDFRPLERKPKARVPDHNKCESYLLAIHARKVLATRRKVT